MIEGLKLTMTGDELRDRLQERMERHRGLVAHYEREAKREPNGDDECDFVLPEHMCEYEQELHGWRADVLEYIRDHIDEDEVYRLRAADLEFGEILPEMPGIVEQEEYERKEGIRFSMERIAKEIGSSGFGMGMLADAIARRDEARVGDTSPRSAADGAGVAEEVAHRS